METKPSDPNRKCCENCHFFIKRVISPEPSNPRRHLDFLMPRKDIEALKAGKNMEYENATIDILCHQGVWAGENPANGETLSEIIEMERGDSCFFFRFQLGMEIGAAVTLELRQRDRMNADNDRALTRSALKRSTIAIWVSVAALILNLGWNVGWNLWEHFNPYKEPTTTMPDGRDVALPVLTSSTNGPAGKSSCVEMPPVNSSRNTAIYCLPQLL